MGGAGAWQAATTKLFAAVAPVCGAGYAPTALGEAPLSDLPIWAFHGANDVVVPVSVTDSNVETLRAARGKGNARSAEVRYTRFDSSPAPVGWGDYDGHASWIQVYSAEPEADTGLFQWLLEHRRPESLGLGGGS